MDQETRLTGILDLIDWAGDHAVAVGEDEMLIYPTARLAGQIGGVQFTRRNHHLLFATGQLVAVQIHAVEVIVGAERL